MLTGHILCVKQGDSFREAERISYPKSADFIFKFIVKVSFRNISFFPSLFSFVGKKNYVLGSAVYLAQACPKEKDEAIIQAASQHGKYQITAQFWQDLCSHIPPSQASIWPE